MGRQPPAHAAAARSKLTPPSSAGPLGIGITVPARGLTPLDAAAVFKVVLASQNAATPCTLSCTPAAAPDADASTNADDAVASSPVTASGPIAIALVNGATVWDANTAVQLLVGPVSTAETTDWSAASLVEWEATALRRALTTLHRADADATASESEPTLAAAFWERAAAWTAAHPADPRQPLDAATIIMFGALAPTLVAGLMPAGRSSARAAQAVPTPLRAWCAAVQQHPQVTPALTQYAALSTTTAGTATATAAAAAKPRRELPPYEFKTPFATSGEVLPDPNSDRNVLITSALPYVNNVPHLGNIIGSTLSADAYARFSRLRNRPTLYVCGTDEYGTATETKALQDGTTCQALCDKYHRLHAGVYQWFNISFDTFGRTTTPHQTAIVQDIFKKLDARGHIQAKDMTQLYCETHKSFLADRFVGGTCPHCKSNDAKGDQCDGCGKLLNAVELIDPKCSVCTGKNSQLPPGTVVPPPILRDSAHLFLNLTQAEEEVTKWIRHSSVKGGWSTNSIQITENWLKEGLKPRCITRDLSWGVPVPEDTRPGFEKKVFYVWFDAPIGYPSITAGYTAQWEKWWKDPEHVQLYQFMGKDNVPFHTVLFPSSLLGTGENWTMLHHLSTTDYLQFEGSKFSKSRGVGVFGDTVMTSGVPPDVWRYFLLSNRPETGDSNFTWAAFALANNSELLANLGNFVNRVMRFVDAKYDGVVPPCTPAEPEHQLAAQVDDLVRQYVNDLEHVKIRSGIETAMRVSAAGNAYLQHVGMDGKLLANHRERCDTVVATALNLAHLIASLVFPYLPNTAEAICRQLNVPLSNALATWPQTPRDTAEPPHPFPQALAAGHVLREPEYLFTRIDTEKLDYLMKTFGSASDAQALIASDAKASKKRPTSAAAAAKGGKAAAAEQGPRTPEVEQAEKAVADQGLKVRQLKAEKADKSAIDAEVKTLLALKKALAETIAAASA